MKESTLLYYHIHNDVVAFSTTRHGGVGTGNYSSFNINRYCGDTDDAIKENRRLLCRLLKITDMKATYGSEPKDMKAQIGPGISLDSFEVGNEVYDAFASEGFKMEAISKRQEKWHIDLPECNRLQLIEAGIPSENINMANICTMKQSDTFFSARRLGIQSGRIFTTIQGYIMPMTMITAAGKCHKEC